MQIIPKDASPACAVSNCDFLKKMTPPFFKKRAQQWPAYLNKTIQRWTSNRKLFARIASWETAHHMSEQILCQHR